jgi:hypothetical protein
MVHPERAGNTISKLRSTFAPASTLAGQGARANHRYHDIASEELVAAHTTSQPLLKYRMAVVFEIAALLWPK